MLKQAYTNTIILLAICGCLFLPTMASATSIQKIGFTELSQQAQLVFEGEVVSSIARRHPDTRRIYTYVTFTVKDVVKGVFSETELTLQFSGGEVSDELVVYESLVYPEKGEQGVYFVSTIKRPMVNPLVGWSQGHFMHKDGHVVTNDKRPVMSIEPVFKKTVGELSEGSTGGLELGSEFDQGMSMSQFKRHIKAALR